MYKEKNDKGLGSKTSTIIQQTKHRLTGFCLGLAAGLTLLANTGTAQTPDVQYSTQWTSTNGVSGPFQPFGIVADGNGNIYTADPNNNVISKFDSAGNLLLAWGSQGSADGQFYAAYGLAADGSGNVYVADGYNNRVQKFDGNGNHLLSFGGWGTGAGQFNTPEEVAVDNLGQIYVQDTFNHRIQKFNTSGSYLLEWGSYGTGTNEFMYPRGLAIDASRNVYVADSSNKVKKYNEYGVFLLEWDLSPTMMAWFNGLAVDADGNVYATDVYNHRILKFDGSGNQLYVLGGYGNSDGQFNGPANVTVDSNGTLFVADISNNRVQKFTKIKTLLYTLRQPLTMSLKLNTQSESNGFPVIVQTTYSLTSALNDLKIALGVTNFGTGAKLYTHQRFYDNNTTENSILIRNNAGTEWDANAQIQVTEKAPFVISVSPTSTSGTIKHNYRLLMNLGGMVLQTEGLGTTTWTAEDTNTVSGTTIPLTKLSLAPRGSAVLSGTTNAVVEGTFGWNTPTAVIAP